MSIERGDLLRRITQAVQERLAQEPPAVGLERRARQAAGVRRRGGARGLRQALTSPGVRIIAECKRRSPSAGYFRRRFEPVDLARSYQSGGAAAISVVTEPQFFAGQIGWVRVVRDAVAVPVLQKDFFIAPRQLFEAAIVGADAVLLVTRILPGGLLPEMLAIAAELELEVLLEAHDEDDLDRAIDLRAQLIGINSRDLASFRVDLQGAARLAALVPPDRVVVIESGIGSCDDVRTLQARGLRHFLVGEHLLRSDDPERALRELITCP